MDAKSEGENFEEIIDRIAHESTPTKTSKRASQQTSPTTPTSAGKITARLLHVTKAPSSSHEPTKPPKKKTRFSERRKAEKKGTVGATEAKKTPTKKRAEGKKPKPPFPTSSK
jgi:hypothetical protein